MTRLVQIEKDAIRRVAVVEEPCLRLLTGIESVYELAVRADATGRTLSAVVHELLAEDRLDYDAVYAGRSEWRLLPPVNYPTEPARCHVTGTGLTHLGSAQNRQAMHDANETGLNDSMRMFRRGIEGGKPGAGKIGVAPEWFYKGNGSVLRAHGQSLQVPWYAEDGGEEAEIAGIYWIAANGQPRRIGMAVGNEFSDHQFEKKNYLNLAGSKLRNCSLGPELIIDSQFDSVPGLVKILRSEQVIWSQPILTGENEMCHSLANIEHHHFKFEGHRRPGDLHVHYFGACSLSFGAGVELRDGDVMEISFAGFGRPLRNILEVSRGETRPVTVKTFS